LVRGRRFGQDLSHRHSSAGTSPARQAAEPFEAVHALSIEAPRRRTRRLAVAQYPL